ncbi:MAG: molybdopterin molybdotransferase MoeA [Microbacterium sp.]|nr:molybdopterin molybdotransferase MoeA [Microbacterium sp.]
MVQWRRLCKLAAFRRSMRGSRHFGCAGRAGRLCRPIFIWIPVRPKNRLAFFGSVPRARNMDMTDALPFDDFRQLIATLPAADTQAEARVRALFARADKPDASLGRIEVLAAPRAAGAHVRGRGEDCPLGGELLPAGTLLGSRQLAAAAGAGVIEVVVSRLPRVAVISTGDELRPPGAPLARGQIVESNSVLLEGLVRETGAEVVLRTTVADDGDALRAAVAEASALGADAIVTSGGVSAGAYEVVKTTLPMSFVSVAMQPGKPQGFGGGHPLLFGLPGNPVSVAVSFEVFVRPALLAMQGRTELGRRILRLPALAGWRTPPGRRQYLPVAIEDGGVRPVGPGASHLRARLARAEAYAIVDADVTAVSAGELVDVMLIS